MHRTNIEGYVKVLKIWQTVNKMRLIIQTFFFDALASSYVLILAEKVKFKCSLHDFVLVQVNKA